jgi:hypothetical protein
MSKMCGDTARFHRIRKQRMIKRARARVLRSEIDALRARPNGAAEKAPAVRLA